VTAKAIVDRQFVEVIIAPRVSEDAVKVVAAKQNVRLLECGQWPNHDRRDRLQARCSGLLVQDRDDALVKPEQLKVVTKRAPNRRRAG